MLQALIQKELQFFSFLIINSQMTHNPKTQKPYEVEPTKGKNLILVSNSSDIFGEAPYEMLYHRSSSLNGGYIRRTSSANNLFPGFKGEEAYREDNFHRQQPMSDAQRYAQECLQYQKYHFDDKIRLIIHRMAILAYHAFREKNDHPFLSFFIERFMCTLAKKLLLNRFELLFLEYVFQQSKWKYDNEMISQCVEHFKSFIHIPQSQNSRGMIKNLQIYLLFCAYYSKKSLNDISQEAIYNSFFKTISDKFKEKYQEWSQSSGIKAKINPKTLNIIFRKLTLFQEKERDFIQNYNLLVEDILEISPAYNADKKGKVKKKKKKNSEDQDRAYQVRQDSINMQRIQDNNQLPPQESPPEFSALNFRKKQTSYVSNVDGLDPVVYYNRKNV